MIFLSNSFSLQMVPNLVLGEILNIKVEKLDTDSVKEILSERFVSAIGHEDLALLLRSILGPGFGIKSNRINVVLTFDDLLVVAQYVGSRLPEGATRLPEGATIEFYTVKLV